MFYLKCDLTADSIILLFSTHICEPLKYFVRLDIFWKQMCQCGLFIYIYIYFYISIFFFFFSCQVICPILFIKCDPRSKSNFSNLKFLRNKFCLMWGFCPYIFNLMHKVCFKNQVIYGGTYICLVALWYPPSAIYL